MANIKIMRDSWTGKGTAAPVARALNKAGRCVNGIRVEGGGNVQKFGNNIVIPRTISTGISFAKFCFGFRISGIKATITGGEISLGEIYHTLPDWECTISEDYSYVGIEYDLTSAAYIGPSTSVGLFRTGGGKIRCWLHLFRFTAPVAPATVGTVSWHRTGRLFNIDSPGNFA